jgi:hypothetical protein
MVSGKDQLKPSYNPWDWLGPGVYFWEENPYKALQYAEKCANKSQEFSGEIHTPLVIGAIIELRNCLNLAEPNSINIVKEAFSNLKRSMEQAGETMPENKRLIGKETALLSSTSMNQTKGRALTHMILLEALFMKARKSMTRPILPPDYTWKFASLILNV